MLVLVDGGILQDCTVKCFSIDGLACYMGRRGVTLTGFFLLVLGDVGLEACDDGSTKLFGLSVGLLVVCRRLQVSEA